LRGRLRSGLRRIGLRLLGGRILFRGGDDLARRRAELLRRRDVLVQLAEFGQRRLGLCRGGLEQRRRACELGIGAFLCFAWIVGLGRP
jgi:hypothetical protein